MRFEENGISLWYGTTDAPAPIGRLQHKDRKVSIIIGVSPYDDNHEVEVLYRVNRGPETAIKASSLRNKSTQHVQYYLAKFPALQDGDKVEYFVFCRSKGIQIPKISLEPLASYFYVTSSDIEQKNVSKQSSFNENLAEINNQDTNTSSPIRNLQTTELSNQNRIILTISHPEQNEEIKGSSFTVSGEAYVVNSRNFAGVADIPVDMVEISVTDGNPVTIRDIVGDWSAILNVTKPGPKKIKVTAVIGQDEKSLTRDITIVLDKEKPDLKDLNPYSGQIIGGSGEPNGLFSVLFTGKVEDQSNLEARYRLDNRSFQNLNLEQDPNNENIWSWSEMISNLVVGTHTLEVQAIDEFGNASGAISTFTFVDTGLPTVDITTPETPLHKITWAEGGTSVVVAGTASDPTTGVAKIRWRIDGGNCEDAINVSGDWLKWRLNANILAPGLHNIDVFAIDGEGNENRDTVQIDAAIPFELDDVDLASYLKDLMIFTRLRIRQTISSEPVDPFVLSTNFHQPFDRLIENEYETVSTKSVTQVRIAVEVLRSFLNNYDHFSKYCEITYHTLLVNLGTSYTEIRLARAANFETRQTLANRLGIAESKLDTLFLRPEQITETVLQDVFGLIATTQNDSNSLDSSILSVDQAEILTLRLNNLHLSWIELDQLNYDNAKVNNKIQTPTIVPDIIDESDLTSPVSGNIAYDLLIKRQNYVKTQLEEMQNVPDSINTPLKRFDYIVDSVIGNINISELGEPYTDIEPVFLALEKAYQDGVSIEPILENIPLEIAAFFVLLRIRKISETGIVLDFEWLEFYDILVQVKKQHKFDEWTLEEINKNLTLESNFFSRRSSRPDLITWRSSWRARRVWEKKLDARIKQRMALKQAHETAINATEAATLPILRDALINTIDRQGQPDIDIADWLTQRLSISFKYSGEQKLSRLDQGIETIQDILLALRTGRLYTLTTLAVGTPVPNWEISVSNDDSDVSNDYSESDFDQEWKWMGTFSTWRGAMFAFGYPENYLLPTLRDEMTKAFTQLVKNIRKQSRMTLDKAEEFAKTYIDTLNAPEEEDGNGGDNIPFEIVLTSQLSKEQLRNLRNRSYLEHKDYIDENNGGFKLTPPFYLKEIFYFVPMLLAKSLQKSGEFFAALDWYQTVYAYELPLNERKIYYGLEAEEFIPTVYQRSESWLLNGLNIFDIAKDRANVLTRFTLLSIARCYLAFADAEFTRETNEAISLARHLYITMLKLLELLQVPPPIANWEFDQDEGASASDSTGNGHTVILHGGQWDEKGWNGGAISFNGLDEYAEVEHTPALALGKDQGDFSVTLAFYLRERFTGEHRVILRKGTGLVEDQQWTPGIWLFPDNNHIAFGISTTEHEQIFTSKHPIQLEEWTHIAFVKQGNLLKLYLNAHLDSVRPFNGDSIDFEAPLFIGGDPNEPLFTSTNALFDDIQIYDRALSTDAVIALSGIDIFPQNPVINSLAQHAELNLQKIRTGRNIAGMERVRTETFTEELVLNDGILTPPPTTNLPPTLYRYSTLIERAKQLVSIAQQFEANYFAALQKRDDEEYTLLNAQQDIQLTKETVAIQDLRVIEANENITLMGLQQDRALTQFDTYNSWIEAGPNLYERKMLQNYSDLNNKRNKLVDADVALTAANAALSAATAGPGKGVAAAFAAIAVTGAATYQSFIAKDINRLEAEAQANSFNGNLERRKDEWALQSTLANKDSNIAAQQILQAKINKQIVEQERAIANIQAEHAEAVVEFLHNKFANVELYEWMSDVLGEIYNYFLQQATAMAQLALNQLAFERQERPPALIKNDYWQAPSDIGTQNDNQDEPDRLGITGSARLTQAITKLDLHAFETNKRKLQLVESLSLAKLFPYEFQLFRETGVLPFATPMLLFDQSFPGHYLRLIKSISLSVVGLIPPTYGIRATLSSAGISRVVTGDVVFRAIEVRRPSEMIAFTSTNNATGLFELQPENEFLAPFESVGVDTNWLLQLPKAANRFDFNTIYDVIFTLQYTALYSSDYQRQVIQDLDRTLSAERAYSFKQEFPDLWYNLHQPEALVDEANDNIHVQFTIDRSHFPPNLENLSIDHIVLYFVRSEDEIFEIKVIDLRFDQYQSGKEISYGEAIANEDGVISTRRANGTNWLSIIGLLPVGKWTLVFPNLQGFKDLFRKDKIRDILFIISYSGDTPPWPE